MPKKKRNKVVDEELDVSVKRKRKKPSTEAKTKKRKSKKKRNSKELAVIEEANLKLENRLAKRKAKLAELAVKADVIPTDSESAFLEEYTHIFKSLQKLTRIAEKKYKTSEQSRDIYALMAMYSQMRECIADMRAIKDLNEMSDALIRAILDPLLRSVGQVLVETYFKLQKEIKGNVSKEDQIVLLERLDMATQESAAKVQEHFALGKEQVYRYFSENG